MVVNVHEAKTQLSQLLKRVLLGDTVVIARDGVPVAQLVPMTMQQTARVPNLGHGKMALADNWDSPETNAYVAALMFGEPFSESAMPKATSATAEPTATLAFAEPKTSYSVGNVKATKTKRKRSTATASNRSSRTIQKTK
jgi:prevent-host-death family protein